MATVETVSPGFHTPSDTAASDRASRVAQEGIVAGLLGAAAVAIWFLLVDTLVGRPLWTPSVLGTVLFERGGPPGPIAAIPVSLGMVLMFTWVHCLVFAAIGGVAARLIGVAEEHPGAGFGVVLLFVVFTGGFAAAMALIARPVLGALGWPSILVANLLAAAAMTLYFRRRHPGLIVEP